MSVSGAATPPQKPVLVNLGCGTITHPKRHNFDLVPQVPSVFAIGASGRIPLPSGSVDACFSSHVLELCDGLAPKPGSLVIEGVKGGKEHASKGCAA